MKLSKPKQSQDSNTSWVKLIDTSNSNYKGELRLCSYMNLSTNFSFSTGSSFISNRLSIGCIIILNSLQESLSFCFVFSPSLFAEFFKRGCNFLVSLFLLFKSFGFGRDYLLLLLHFLFGLHDSTSLLLFN